jgi:DNA-binding Lrp family transcriptional regulator
MDKKDNEILKSMMKLKTNNLNVIAGAVELSPSSVQKRIKKMEDEKIITGFIPQLNEDVMPEQLTAISMIRAKYEPEYYDKVGNEISKIDGVCSVYYVLGDYDFIAIIKARNRKELELTIKQISAVGSVERSNTITVLSTLLEDPTLFYRLDD